MSTFKTTIEKQQSFLKELRELLLKYDAEINLEDFGQAYASNEKIVVDFGHDESFFETEETGIIPQLILGKHESGK